VKMHRIADNGWILNVTEVELPGHVGQQLVLNDSRPGGVVWRRSPHFRCALRAARQATYDQLKHLYP
jgi:hypothetical protein